MITTPRKSLHDGGDPPPPNEWIWNGLFGNTDFVEIRALSRGKILSGYFDDPKAIAVEARRLDERGFNVYTTMNPLVPELRSEVTNEVGVRKKTASDTDILRRRFLLVDIDPIRSSGIPATDKEKESAVEMSKRVKSSLVERGWPDPIVADSGNGVHLLYHVDLPNDDETRELLKGVLWNLSKEFTNEEATIDTTTSNAGRLLRLYGTTNRKGVETVERPHRVTRIVEVPDVHGIVAPDALHEVAGPVEEPARSFRTGSHLDLRKWVKDYEVPVRKEGEWQDGYRYVLKECPFNGHMDGSCYVVQLPNGAIHAGCHHDSCNTGENRWRELRQYFEGRTSVIHGPQGVLLSEVESTEVEWLMRGRIPFGKVCIVDGDPGVGKSTLTIDLASRLSEGREFPDGSRHDPAGVVILSVEDGLSDTILPRVDAAGGVRTRMKHIGLLKTRTGERRLCLPDDIPEVEKAVGEMQARMVIVDPFMAFLPKGVDAHKDQDVRSVLTPLAAMAERTGAVVLIVRHLNKTIGGSAIYRGGGSIGIVGAARSAHLVAPHPDGGDLLVLAPTKSNLSATMPALCFRLETTPNGVVRIRWEDEICPFTADELLALNQNVHKRLQAKQFLYEKLHNGAIPVRQVYEEAEKLGISESTIKRAKTELSVEARRVGGIADAGSWVWSLPNGYVTE